METTINPCECEIAIVHGDDSVTNRVIFCPLHAAADDLLAALKDVRDFLKRSGYDTRIVQAAIAKAEPELREARLAAIKDRLDKVAAKAIRAAEEKP